MIISYHRPASIADALKLLGRQDPPTVVLGGGTIVGRHSDDDRAVVDLQALGLQSIRPAGDCTEIGAMTRLQELIDDDAVPFALGELAKREAPSTLRNAATIGGTVAVADPESELLAGLLVHQARVTVTRPDGRDVIELEELLADRSPLDGGIITAVTVAVGGRTAAARTGRTPADTSIVAAVARRDDDNNIRLALTGVAATPILVAPGEEDGLDPPADFRGSSEYRRHLAETLTRRAIADLG